MRAVVVALGDLGRSARMRYHAQALAAHGVDVDLVGLEGTPLPRAISEEPRIHVHRITPPGLRARDGLRPSTNAMGGPPTLAARAGLTPATYAMAGLLDAARVSFRLWRLLANLRRPDLVLVQN